MLYAGKTTASYFWDDGSGINGDTGAPASGEPMQKGLAASPSWPMGTKGYVIYQGRTADFFVGDRGPGVPSSSGVMLDLDGKTFADLTGGTWDGDSLTVEGAGGLGHIPVQYVITEWGKGRGKTGAPKPFSTGAYGVRDQAAPPPPCPTSAPAPSVESQTTASTPAAKAAPAQKPAQESAQGSSSPAPAAQAEAAAAAMAPSPAGRTRRAARPRRRGRTEPRPRRPPRPPRPVRRRSRPSPPCPPPATRPAATTPLRPSPPRSSCARSSR